MGSIRSPVNNQNTHGFTFTTNMTRLFFSIGAYLCVIDSKNIHTWADNHDMMQDKIA